MNIIYAGSGTLRSASVLTHSDNRWITHRALPSSAQIRISALYAGDIEPCEG